MRGIRSLPVGRLLALAEIASLAYEHINKLEPHERRRVLELLRVGQGRPTRLSRSQRDELTALLRKAEPRLFIGTVAEKLSPLPLPRRVVRGRRR
jgi:hypothetical protein